MKQISNSVLWTETHDLHDKIQKPESLNSKKDFFSFLVFKIWGYFASCLIQHVTNLILKNQSVTRDQSYDLGISVDVLQSGRPLQTRRVWYVCIFTIPIPLICMSYSTLVESKQRIWNSQRNGYIIMIPSHLS